MKNMHILKSIGINPAVAFGFISLDMMLFSGEVVTLGLNVVLTAIIGFIFGFVAIFLQKYCYNDSWGAAIGKGVLLGLLTAIPTAVPSVVTGTLGVFGYIGKCKETKQISN
ncbi:hypothetical protein AAEX28_07630 [Lentisphaerota bacterium WC36G]|nr:hypothetical protein LJT99_10490 [Lentisphaerae bacterium WC36]